MQKVKEFKYVLTPVKEHCQIRQTSSVKDIETSRAKNKKKMREIASASQMSGRSRTYVILPDMQFHLHPLRSSEEQMATYEGKYKRTVQIVNLPCQVLSLLKMLNDRFWMLVLFPLFGSSILNLHLRTLRNLFLLNLLRLLPGCSSKNGTHGKNYGLAAGCSHCWD
ncbi:uncharacterized protein LOC108198758 isoform X2 [Daucus carota subsp. sativus]|uniref:uncharacterized protein LOC108198758 isoform X2 n=1 Tax=Daucus carota subsp. sativus TaxID=79200 RepID=UPI003083CF3D